ncbi:MAG TPA: NADH-dependent [FeFe] hydrogenase, group A6 [Kiritimatiellia bacterium]|nr:NADH-dependent [FeFe] hydrogenase, group A6 [Kiritimatiellia bacterium]HNS80960.1 NADH-dependent [FeFe] hydrogenase, group A6 [Kiritimatiellia bacterium]
MITIEVNGRPIAAKKGEMLIAALDRAGIKVPTLCYMKDRFPTGACRMCVVEIEGQKGLIPSCAYPVAEGMKVQTHSPRAVNARKTIVELLLADHPDDCLYCVRNGNCDLQKMAEDLGLRRRRYAGEKSVWKMDLSSPAIERDPDKCILCGKCVRTCEEVQGVSAISFAGRGCRTFIGTAFNEGMNISSCVYCGQCIKVCPTGALRERSSIKEVWGALNDPEMTVVVQHAPSVSVTVGDAFGVKPGVDMAGAMTTALRRLGFDYVFDTSFSADLTIMEEASELVQRIKTGGKLPMMTSCSPGWIKYVEQNYPEFMGNLSTCKSPQQMMGAVIKSYFAEKMGLSPKKIFSVSIMPCTAKKFEATRSEMGTRSIPDIDAVLTTREFIRMIRMSGLDLNDLEPDTADTPFGERSTAGKLFGASGGVMEAAVRTAHYLLTGRELKVMALEAVRGMKDRKEAQLEINGMKIGIAVVNGLGGAKPLLDEIRAGRDDLHFIEVMTCPGGCINGGGQPIDMNMDAVKARMAALYQLDAKARLRTSHSNPSIMRIYKEFLGDPLGPVSHRLLHTKYMERKVLN